MRTIAAFVLLVGACSSSSSAPEPSSTDAGEECSTTGEGGVLVDLSGVPADVPAKIILEGPGGRLEMGTGESARVAAGRYAILGRGAERDPRNERVFYEPILPKYTECIAAGVGYTSVHVTFKRYTQE